MGQIMDYLKVPLLKFVWCSYTFSMLYCLEGWTIWVHSTVQLVRVSSCEILARIGTPYPHRKNVLPIDGSKVVICMFSVSFVACGVLFLKMIILCFEYTVFWTRTLIYLSEVETYLDRTFSILLPKHKHKLIRLWCLYLRLCIKYVTTKRFFTSINNEPTTSKVNLI